LKDFLNRRYARQEVLGKYSGTDKKILLKKCRKLRLQGRGRSPGAWGILTMEVGISKFLEPDFDLGPAVRISSKGEYEFMMHLFFSPSSSSRNIEWGIFVHCSPSIVDNVLCKLDKFITFYFIP
jgi:hypothetical protein